MSTPTETPQEPQAAVNTTQNQTVSLNTSQFASLCAAGLFICFFLPWMQIMFSKPSGMDIAKEGGKLLLLWAIPIFCGVTIYAGITKGNQKAIAQLTGALPFFVLGFGLYHMGQEMITKMMQIGGYAGLALGLVLFILARRLK